MLYTYVCTWCTVTLFAVVLSKLAASNYALQRCCCSCMKQHSGPCKQCTEALMRFCTFLLAVGLCCRIPFCSHYCWKTDATQWRMMHTGWLQQPILQQPPICCKHCLLRDAVLLSTAHFAAVGLCCRSPCCSQYCWKTDATQWRMMHTGWLQQPILQQPSICCKHCLLRTDFCPGLVCQLI